MHLPDQDLAGFDRIEATRPGSRKTSSVPRAEQSFGLEVQLATGDVDVNERRIRDGDALAGFESRDMERGVTVADPDRRLVPGPVQGPGPRAAPGGRRAGAPPRPRARRRDRPRPGRLTPAPAKDRVDPLVPPLLRDRTNRSQPGT